jgi:hypothetical protein
MDHHTDTAPDGHRNDVHTDARRTFPRATPAALALVVAAFALVFVFFAMALARLVAMAAGHRRTAPAPFTFPLRRMTQLLRRLYPRVPILLSSAIESGRDEP